MMMMIMMMIIWIWISRTHDNDDIYPNVVQYCTLHYLTMMTMMIIMTMMIMLTMMIMMMIMMIFYLALLSASPHSSTSFALMVAPFSFQLCHNHPCHYQHHPFY